MKQLILSAIPRGLLLFLMTYSGLTFALSPVDKFAIAEKVTTYRYENSDTHVQTITQAQTVYTSAGTTVPGSTAQVSLRELDGFTGTQLATIDNHAHRIAYAHDSLGREIAIDYGQSQETITYKMTATGSWKTIHQPDGRRTETTYVDALGRKKASYDNARGQQPLEQLTYNDLGQVQEKVNSDNIAKQYHYDALGQTRQLETGLVGQPPLLTQFTDYDAVANKMTQYSQAADGSQSAKTIQYKNDANQLVHQIWQNVSPTVKTIDNFAHFDNFSQRLDSQTAGSNDARLTTYQYSATGSLKTALMGSTKTQSVQVNFSQDLLGDLVTKQLSVLSSPTTAPLMRYVKRYNSKGKLIAEILVGGQGNAKTAAKPLIKRYHYDASGNLTGMDDWQLLQAKKRRLSIHYRYTSVLGHEKVSEMQVPSYQGQAAYSIVSTYNHRTGKLTDTYKTSHQGKLRYQHIHYQYDPNTLWLLKKTYNDAESIAYRYDKTSGRLRSITNPQGYITKLFYQTALKKLSRAVIYRPDGKTALAEVIYRYNALQHLARKYRYRFSADGLTPIPVDTTLYRYNKIGTVTDVAHQFSNTYLGHRIERMHYVYNSDGSLAQERYWLRGRANYRVTRYRYDDLKRLIYSSKSEYGQTGFAQRTITHYQFDINSNMIGKEVRQFNQLQHGEQTNHSQVYRYNGLDQLVAAPEQTATINYEPETGDMLNDGQGRQYRYDALHKLIHLQTKTKDLADYNYGSDGLRASKTGLDTQGQPITLHYFYNGKQLLATQTDEKNNSVHNNAFYFFGLGREARLIMKQGQSVASICFYGEDRHSVSSTLAFDGQGRQTLRYQQADDYGKPLGVTSTDTRLSIDYDPYSKAFSEYSEQETQGQLQYRPARELNTVTHQFTTLDNDNDFMNRYGYCEGDPIGKVDVSGNSSFFTSKWLPLGGVEAFEFIAGVRMGMKYDGSDLAFILQGFSAGGDLLKYHCISSAVSKKVNTALAGQAVLQLFNCVSFYATFQLTKTLKPTLRRWFSLSEDVAPLTEGEEVISAARAEGIARGREEVNQVLAPFVARDLNALDESAPELANVIRSQPPEEQPRLINCYFTLREREEAAGVAGTQESGAARWWRQLISPLVRSPDANV